MVKPKKVWFKFDKEEGSIEINEKILYGFLIFFCLVIVAALISVSIDHNNNFSLAKNYCDKFPETIDYSIDSFQNNGLIVICSFKDGSTIKAYVGYKS